MSSGWAGALGAAILGGQQGYQTGKQNQQEQAMRALQAAILKAQLDDIPARRAMEDANAIYQLSPEQALHNPAFVDARQRAGVPVLTKPRPQPWEMERNGIETPGRAANRLGIAEETGAVIPPEIQAAAAERQLNLQKTQNLTNWMSNPTASGGGAGIVGAKGEPEPPRFDAGEVQAWQRAKLAGIPMPEPQETAQHKLWMERQQLTDKATMKPPSAATEKERQAYAKIQSFLPELKQALMGQVMDPNDPTGQNAMHSAGGIAGLIGQRIKQGVKNTAYNAGFPLADNDEKAVQLAGALRVIGTSPYMNGSRSMQMFNEAAQHLVDRNGTPEAQIQRLNEIEKLFPEFEQAIGISGSGTGASGIPTPGGAPPTAPAKPVVPAAVHGALRPAPGQPMPYSELMRLYGGDKTVVDQKATELIRQGVPVTMDVWK